MERMTVLSTNKSDWPVILDLLSGRGLEVQENKMDNLEWEFTLIAMDGTLQKIRTDIDAKTLQTICMGIETFYQLLFTIECKPEELRPRLDEIGRQFQVEIKVGHLSENGWHISIEDNKEVLEKIRAFLAKNGITASLF